MGARISSCPRASRSARPRGGVGHAVRFAPPTRGRCDGRARPCHRRAGHRREERDDPLHAPSAFVVLYDDLGEERRAVHERIAGIADDPLLRASHLAHSTECAGHGIAAMLDDAASLATDRGAPASAAELAEHALRLTPPDPAMGVIDGRSQLRARTSPQGNGPARERSPLICSQNRTRGPLRAEALLLLAEFQHDDLAVPASRGGLARGGVAPGAQGAHPHPPRRGGTVQECVRGSPRGHRAALELADRLDDDALRFEALRTLRRSAAWWAAPTPRLWGAPARSCNRLRRPAPPAGGECPRLGILHDSGDLDEERVLLETRAPKVAGARRASPLREVPWDLSWLELWAGRWELAAAHAARAHDICVQYGVEKNQDYIPSTWVAVHRGQLELGQEQSDRALKLCEEQIGFHPPLLEAVPGSSLSGEETRRRPPNCLGEADRQAPVLGWGSPDARPWTADYAEALLELGRIDDAVESSTAGKPMRPSRSGPGARAGDALPRPRRCSPGRRVDEGGLILGAGGCRALRDRRCLRTGSRAARAWGRLRRARHKRAARDAIEAALDAFENLGASTWARERAGARTDQRAYPRGRADRGGAPGRDPCRRWPHEPAGRRRAVSRRADRGEPPDPYLREAGVRSRTELALKLDVLTFFQRVAPTLASRVCRATSSRRISLVAAPESGTRASSGCVRPQRADGGDVARPFRPLDLLPEDEICFFIFDASSGREAALVAEHAELDPSASSRWSRRERSSHEAKGVHSRSDATAGTCMFCRRYDGVAALGVTPTSSRVVPTTPSR